MVVSVVVVQVRSSHFFGHSKRSERDAVTSRISQSGGNMGLLHGRRHTAAHSVQIIATAGQIRVCVLLLGAYVVRGAAPAQRIIISYAAKDEINVPIALSAFRDNFLRFLHGLSLIGMMGTGSCNKAKP